MEVRTATLADVEPIHEIYDVEVLTSTATFDLRPRTPDERRAWLLDRSGAHAVIVAADGDEIVGFGSLSPYRDRPAYSTTVEDSVYVRRDRQGTGVGKLVLGELVAVATRHGFHSMVARIAGGEASIALHRALGFETVGTEREVGRKFNRWLDVVVMQKLL